MSDVRERNGNGYVAPDFMLYDSRKPLSPEEKARLISDLPAPAIAIAMTRVNTTMSDNPETWRELFYNLQLEFRDKPFLLGNIQHQATSTGIILNPDVSKFFAHLYGAEAITKNASVRRGPEISEIIMTNTGKRLIDEIHGLDFQEYNADIDRMAMLIENGVGVKPKQA